MEKNSGQEFMRNTYYDRTSLPPQQQGLPQPPLELPLPEGKQLLSLKASGELKMPELDLRTAVEQRRTIRGYAQSARPSMRPPTCCGLRRG
jgi:hypothetical protein